MGLDKAGDGRWERSRLTSSERGSVMGAICGVVMLSVWSYVMPGQADSCLLKARSIGERQVK